MKEKKTRNEKRDEGREEEGEMKLTEGKSEKKRSDDSELVHMTTLPVAEAYVT